VKTLGQIAREAYDAAAHDYRRTADQQDHEWWGAAAQAVRAAVIDQCAKEFAKVCDERNRRLVEELKAYGVM
jgi:hypothetical protein